VKVPPFLTVRKKDEKLATKEIHYLRGKLHWTKVLGDPVDNYGKDGKEWVFDLALDADGVKQVKSIKVNGKPALTIKNKGDDRGDFVTFKQKYRELPNGKFTTAPKVADATGTAWDQNTKIGNGSDADVKFEVVDYGKTMYAGIYPRAIRVLKHVAYAEQDFSPLSEDDKFFKKASDSETPFDSYGGHTASDEDEFDDVPV
jgi:hypothetical protein